jgi:hypothetical protein
MLPKATEAGNPDFRIWDGKTTLWLYRGQKPEQYNLDPIATSEQLKRYLATFPNLLLTNFYEFRCISMGSMWIASLSPAPSMPPRCA